MPVSKADNTCQANSNLNGTFLVSFSVLLVFVSVCCSILATLSAVHILLFANFTCNTQVDLTSHPIFVTTKETVKQQKKRRKRKKISEEKEQKIHNLEFV